jgi:hypothetical protein
MTHPDLASRDPVPEWVRNGHAEMSDSVLAPIAFVDTSAEVMREQLVTIADSEDRDACVEKCRINLRVSRLIDAAGPARDDDPFTRMKFGSRSVARANVGEDS